MTLLPISQLVALHRSQPEKILETLQEIEQRIDKFNPKLNAIVQRFQEDAAQRAKALSALDSETARSLPLFGVPVTIKESFAYKSSPCTINFPPLKNYAPEESSILAQRLEDAGAIIVGKTNVPTMLSDCQTFGPLYPTANNPYDFERTPGGSTGGGAAALAACLCYGEIGSDIGGSIRNPSNFCGLYGLKPTQNGHVHDGHVPPMPNKGHGFLMLNSTGPLARSAHDLEQLYQVCFQPLPNYLQYMAVQTSTPVHSDLGSYKVAYFDSILGTKCSRPTREGLQRVLAKLRESGAEVNEIKLDDKLVQKTLQTWVKLFGFVAGQDFSWPIRKLMQFKFTGDLKGSKIDAKKSLREGLSLDFNEYSKALLDQKECIAEFCQLFDKYDFIVSPTSLGPAFKHNHKHQPIELEDIHYPYADYCFGFVMLYNLLGNPVLNIPSGLDSRLGLPIGISIASSHYSEKQLMHFGRLLEQKGFTFQPPSGF